MTARHVLIAEMLFKKMIAPEAEKALAEVYAIVDRVLTYKNDPRYMPCVEDLQVLVDLKKNLVEASELIQFMHAYLENKMTTTSRVSVQIGVISLPKGSP